MRDGATKETGAGAESQNADVIPSSESRSPAFERHFTVAEVATMWNLSKDAVRRMFRHEPGVLLLGDRANNRKQRYVTLRIPKSVLTRVHLRCSLYS